MEVDPPQNENPQKAEVHQLESFGAFDAEPKLEIVIIFVANSRKHMGNQKMPLLQFEMRTIH